MDQAYSKVGAIYPRKLKIWEGFWGSVRFKYSKAFGTIRHEA